MGNIGTSTGQYHICLSSIRALALLSLFGLSGAGFGAGRETWQRGPRHPLGPDATRLAGPDAAIYEIGDLAVFSVSPNLAASEPLQRNTPGMPEKIRPKLSSEIKSNYVGTTPPRLPRSPEGDLQPFLPFHLQDGDPATVWMSRGQARDSVQPEWIRIDLPYEQLVKSVRLWPLAAADGGFPRELMVEISRDGWHWEKVFESKTHEDPQDGKPLDYPLTPPRQAKQVRITGRKFRYVTMGAATGSVSLGYAFALRGAQVHGADGRDLASIANGAGVIVSSVNYGYPDKRSIHDKLWPVHYDLGVKHLKIAYWDSTLNWHWVEREKGKYVFDPRTDQCISECNANGVEVYMTLAYGNWLYTPQGSPPGKGRLWQFPFDKSPVPLDPAYRQAYCHYVRAVVEHFKGRIRWFEIWNEQNVNYSWPPGKVAEYAQLVKEAAAVIREANPEAGVMLGGACFLDLEYFQRLFEEGVAPLVDAICWHPYQWEVAPEESYRPPEQRHKPDPYPDYRARVKALQAMARRYGFTGHIWQANEQTWVSPYPAPDFGVPGGPVSEMLKAKYVARTICLHADMDIPVYYNETWNTGITFWDCSLLRNTYSAWPESPLTPQPAYYVLRTLATATDGAKPAPWPVQVKIETGQGNMPAYEICRLNYPNGDRLFGIWLSCRAADVHPGLGLTVMIPNWKGQKAQGIHLLNGTTQPLKVEQKGETLVIPDLIVRDYPLLIHLLH